MADFHSSVVHNHRLYLESERISVLGRLKAIRAERGALDRRRADVMNLLNNSMTLETFRNTERGLAEVDSAVADLERRLELVQSVNDAGLYLRSITAEVEASIRTEIAEREKFVEEAISLFRQLGEEVYDDHDVSLFIDANKGILKITLEIDDDALSGVREVKTFLLDVVCLVMAIKAGRAPRILVHDSLLLSSMDDRRVASCLSIGARLADDMGFQYIVTLNSDRLQAAEAEGFDRRGYAIDPALTDAGEDGGLFSFRPR